MPTHSRRSLRAVGLVASLGLAGGWLSACAGDHASPAPQLMPEFDHPAGAICIREYPAELDKFPIAFDGRIVKQEETGEELRPSSPDALRPVVVTFFVEEGYRGVGSGSEITLRTFDYEPETPMISHVGERFLVAAQDSLDLHLCGYTRPSNEQDRRYWAETFMEAPG